jgi:multidrug resistance protein, MATE family
MFAAPRTEETLSAEARLSHEVGATFSLAWPLVLANIAVTVMTTTDYVMLGRLSPKALAAGALGFNLYQPAFLLGVGVVGALSPIASAKIGAGEPVEGLRRSTHQALLSALAIAAAAWVVLSQTTAILTAIGEPPELAKDAGRYMSAFQWGLAPNLMFFAGRSVFAALERPRAPLIAGLVAVVFNAVANYALVFGKLGLPAFGIFGSGLATTLSQTLMLTLLVAFSVIDPRLRRLRLFALPWRLVSHDLAALWRLGLPIGLMIAAEVGIFVAATLAMGLLGAATLEAHTVALQIASLAFMVPLGLGQAASVRIGRGYGARDRNAIARAGLAAFGLTLAFALASATTMVLAPRTLVSLFLTPDSPEDAAAVGIAFVLLRIAAIFQIFDASQAVLANMLRGLHDSRWPLVIALVGYWGVGAPVGVGLGFGTLLGGVGIWIGLAAGLAAVALLLGSRWLGKARRGFVTPALDQGARQGL